MNIFRNYFNAEICLERDLHAFILQKGSTVNASCSMKSRLPFMALRVAPAKWAPLLVVAASIT